MKNALLGLAIVSIIFTAACSSKKPWEGKWEVSVGGMTSTVEYSGSSYKSFSDNPYCQEAYGKVDVDESAGTMTIETTKTVGKQCPKIPKSTMKFEVKGDKLIVTVQGMNQTYTRVN